MVAQLSNADHTCDVLHSGVGYVEDQGWGDLRDQVPVCLGYRTVKACGPAVLEKPIDVSIWILGA